MGRKKKKKQIPRRCDFLWNFAKGYKVICWVNEREREREREGGRDQFWAKNALCNFFLPNETKKANVRMESWFEKVGDKHFEREKEAMSFSDICSASQHQVIRPFRTFVAHLNIKLFDLLRLFEQFEHFSFCDSSTFFSFRPFSDFLHFITFQLIRHFAFFDLSSYFCLPAFLWFFDLGDLHFFVFVLWVLFF